MAPDLTDEQYCALRDFIIRHREEGTCSATPIRLARVLAEDKPATLLPSSPDFPTAEDDYHASLLDRIGYPYRQVEGIPGWIVSPTGWRLELLPSVKNEFRLPDAYHKRLGVVFGYPSDAIEYFIHKDGSESSKYDVVTSDEFNTKEAAYTRFVCHDHPQTKERYDHYISTGKQIRQRISQLAREWNIPELDALADDAYNDEVDAINNGGRKTAPDLTIDFDLKNNKPIQQHSQN